MTVKIVTYRPIEPGPTLTVLGAVHGNERCGAEAIGRMIKDVDDGFVILKRGTLQLVPVTNPRAYQGGRALRRAQPQPPSLPQGRKGPLRGSPRPDPLRRAGQDQRAARPAFLHFARAARSSSSAGTTRGNWLSQRRSACRTSPAAGRKPSAAATGSGNRRGPRNTRGPRARSRSRSNADTISTRMQRTSATGPSFSRWCIWTCWTQVAARPWASRCERACGEAANRAHEERLPPRRRARSWPSPGSISIPSRRARRWRSWQTERSCRRPTTDSSSCRRKSP